MADNIYADGTCEEDGIHGNKQIPGDFLLSATLEDFWAHWKYSKEDDSYRNLLSSMAYYIVWDDHEVVNNFGPFFDTRDAAPYTSGEHLMPMGLQAYLDYNPIRYSEVSTHTTSTSYYYRRNPRLTYLTALCQQDPATIHR
jgi:alkaline phosphatase D